MTTPREYQVGERVRVTRDTMVANVGDSGKIVSLVRDASGQITVLQVLMDGNPPHLYGTTVFLADVEPCPPLADTPETNPGGGS